MQNYLSGKSIYTEAQYKYYSKVDSSEPQKHRQQRCFNSPCIDSSKFFHSSSVRFKYSAKRKIQRLSLIAKNPKNYVREHPWLKSIHLPVLQLHSALLIRLAAPLMVYPNPIPASLNWVSRPFGRIFDVANIYGPISRP